MGEVIGSKGMAAAEAELERRLAKIMRLTADLDAAKTILQGACDRDWKDESLYQTAMIVCNAIYWRDREIERLKACCAYDPYEERNRRDL